MKPDTVIPRWVDYVHFNGKSDPSKLWTVQENDHTPGQFRCNCPSYIYAKTRPKACKHTAWAEADRLGEYAKPPSVPLKAVGLPAVPVIPAGAQKIEPLIGKVWLSELLRSLNVRATPDQISRMVTGITLKVGPAIQRAAAAPAFHMLGGKRLITLEED